LNGCCYGGICQSGLPSQHFPLSSPPYMHQLYSGQLLGLTVRELDADTVTITRVAPGSLAEKSGLKAGDALRAWPDPDNESDAAVRHSRFPSPNQLEQAMREPPAAPLIQLLNGEGEPVASYTFDEIPKISLPIHPTQLYAAFNALLLTLLLILLTPFKRYDGVVFATLFTLYPIARFLLEIIRTDESGQFGTGLTISQWLSVFAIGGVALLWAYILRTRRPATWNLGQYQG
jgi:phosphatidylglycerol---prolipoprotein diacylglyceryl transferase